MLHDIFLLLCICACGVISTLPPVYPDTTTVTMTTTTVAPHLSLKAMASPDYPVAAGQTVKLYCSVVTNVPSVIWYWQYWIKQTWQPFERMMNLTLTAPNQTGTYRCSATAKSIVQVSNNLTVFIVAMPPTGMTVGDNLGIAAIVLSVLALIMAITVLTWWGLERYGGTMTTTNTVAVKGFPGPGKIPKGDFPQTGSDGDVYMNYTSGSQAYTNLDPTNMTADNVYSSLS